MSWNYRMVRHSSGNLFIHEVYYYSDGTPKAMSTEPIIPQGEDRYVLLEDLIYMQEALEKEIFEPPYKWNMNL